MTLQTKIYIAGGVAIVLIVMTMSMSMWMTNHRITQAERAASAAKQAAAEKEKLAAEKETEAAGYKEKSEYLEKQVAEIEATARKQDEEIERTKSNSAAARSRVDRARSVRSVDTTADELCGKLAEVGHGCEESFKDGGGASDQCCEYDGKAEPFRTARRQAANERKWIDQRVCRCG